MLYECLKNNSKTIPMKKVFISKSDSLTNLELYIKVKKILYFFIDNKIINKKIIIEFHEEIDIIPAFFASIILGNNICLVDLKRMEKLKIYIESVFLSDILIANSKIIFKNQNLTFEQVYSVEEIKDLDHIIIENEKKNRDVLTIFTSGSTGTPKGIIIKKENINFSICSVASKLKFTPTDKIGLFLPITFDYGLYHLFFTIISKCSLEFFSKEYSEFELISFIEDRKITFLPSLPKTTMNILWLASKNSKFNISSLRAITNTGEYLNPESQKTAWKLNPDLNIYFMYGITECKRVSILSPEEYRIKPTSVGKAIPGTEVFIKEENSEILKKTGYGELIVKGPHIAAGYLETSDDNSACSFFMIDNEKFFKTGDLFYIDTFGYLFFEGRKSDFIKHNGFRLDPYEIEHCILDLPNIIFTKVITFDNKVVLIFQGDHPIKEVYSVLKNKLDYYKIPKILKLEKIPLTKNGKVDIDNIKNSYYKMRSL